MTNVNHYDIIIALMRSWRNWQTRKTKDLVGNSMQVQFLSTAPKQGIYAENDAEAIFDADATFANSRLESFNVVLFCGNRAVKIYN